MATCRYHVVEFLGLPYAGIDKYVVVPHNWIRWYQKDSGRVAVGYPEGDPAFIEHCVMNNTNHSDSWKIHMALVKYTTAIYRHAINFIKMQENVASSASDAAESTSGGTTSQQNSQNPRKNTPSNPGQNGPQKNVAPLNNVSKSVLNPSSPGVIDKKAFVKSSQVQEMIKSIVNASKQSDISIDSVKGKRSSVHEDFLNALRIQKITGANDMKGIEKYKPDASTETVPTLVQDTLRSANQSLQSSVLTEESFCMRFCVLFGEMRTGFDQYSSALDHLQLMYSRNVNLFEEMTKLVIDYCDWKNLSASMTPKTGELAVEISDEEVEKEVAADGYDKATKIARHEVRKFTLPPEYDPNDSRWTLRYHKPAPGLLELIPGSGIYVNAVKLANCNRLSSDCKSFARKLMMEIFSDSALKVCSLTGARLNFLHSSESDVRPGLDENARRVLLTFVKNYGPCKGLCDEQMQTIVNSMRNRLQKCRERSEMKSQ